MIIHDLPIEKYHNEEGAPRWLSKTSIMAFRKNGPAWWKLRYLDRVIDDHDTKAMATGRALDEMLTGHDFLLKFAVKPAGMSFATKDGKAWRDDHPGMEFLTEEEYSIVCDCRDAVMDSWAWPHIQMSRSQTTIRRQTPGAPFGLQSRPDWLNPLTGIYLDLKKTADLDKFPKQAIDLGYHLQAAICGWCLGDDRLVLEKAYLVAVEWQRGARCEVYEITGEQLEHGFRICQRTADEISKRLESGDWSNPRGEPVPLPVPEWMARKMDSETNESHG